MDEQACTHDNCHSKTRSVCFFLFFFILPFPHTDRIALPIRIRPLHLLHALSVFKEECPTSLEDGVDQVWVEAVVGEVEES